jgi:hypothetical protein
MARTSSKHISIAYIIIGYCHHWVNGINYGLAQCDPITGIHYIDTSALLQGILHDSLQDGRVVQAPSRPANQSSLLKTFGYFNVSILMLLLLYNNSLIYVLFGETNINLAIKVFQF